ncbi:MAG: enoyl-CoA hydratase-related protein [Bacteroidales bacterium]
MYQYIETHKQNEIATLWLNRPKKRNAMHEQMIEELMEALKEFRRDESLKALVIRGKGNVFCAGADLQWMQSVMQYSFNENKLESKQLYRLFHTLYSYPLPVISVVHGASYGGANGLVAASDISIAESKTLFRFSEVQLGLLPAIISPFVVRRTGEFNARELMLTGQEFNADKALKTGLINYKTPTEGIEQQLEVLLASIRSAAITSVKNTKWMIRKVAANMDMEELEDITADLIASARVSNEGQEGMKAFSEKRKPNWQDMSKQEN